ncbi:MAG: tetratricopeptide repeat protein [Planctomycetia bacterium]|nr:tetratricopeptide repeat protein [Planctomycetia bacterium]
MGVADLKSKARDSFKRKNYDLSVEMYLEVIQLDPNDIEALEGLHQAAEKRREGKGKSLFGGMGRLGIASVRDPQKKIAAAARHLAKNPDDKEAWMSLGEAGEAGNFLNAAQFGFKMAAKLDPEDNTAWKSLGAALYRQGKIKEASDAYGEAARIDPKDQEALKMRKNLAAEGALKQGGYETAKSSRELIKDKEVAGRLERDTRLQLTDQDATDEAARLRADLEKNPANATRTRLRLADVLQQQGNTDAALEQLELVLKTDPGNYDLSIRIGDMKLQKLQVPYDEARRRYAVSETDENLAAFQAARTALVEARLAEYGRRVREHPTDLGERFRLGLVLLMANRLDEAIGEFQKTVQDPRKKTDSLMRLADCFEKKNLLDLAVKQVAKAAEDFPQLNSDRAKEITFRLGELHEKRGAKEDARREYTKIYEVDISYRDVGAKLEGLGS